MVMVMVMAARRGGPGGGPVRRLGGAARYRRSGQARARRRRPGRDRRRDLGGLIGGDVGICLLDRGRHGRGQRVLAHALRRSDVCEALAALQCSA